MIKKYRKIKGITQEELAEMLDITPRQVQRLENYQSDTRLSTLKKLIKCLEIKDKDIIEYLKKWSSFVFTLIFLSNALTELQN